jgi:hypothetical protein
MSEFKGYVVGWAAPTYVPMTSFLSASQHTNGYDVSVVYNYHASAFASVIDEIVRKRRKAGVFVRQIRKDKNGALFSLVLERKQPDSLETYPDVTFRIPLNPTQPAEVLSVDHRFSMSLSELQALLNDTRSKMCSAAVLAKLARYITKHGAVSLRKGGGAYFIPQMYYSLVDTVERTVEALGGEVMKFAVTGQDYELKTVFESFKEQFQTTVTQLRLRAEKAKREKTHEKLGQELAEIINTVSVYKDILSAYAQELDQIFDTAKRTVIQAMSIQTNRTDEPEHTDLAESATAQYVVQVSEDMQEPIMTTSTDKQHISPKTQQMILLI